MRISVAAAGIALLTSGAAMLAAPGQDRPGQITPARVWIENRGSGQEIPVQIIQMPSVTIAGSTTLPVRPTRQTWEYQTLTVPTGQDPTPLLAPLGVLGWEATGAALPGQNGVLLLLKRSQ